MPAMRVGRIAGQPRGRRRHRARSVLQRQRQHRAAGLPQHLLGALPETSARRRAQVDMRSGDLEGVVPRTRSDRRSSASTCSRMISGRGPPRARERARVHDAHAASASSPAGTRSVEVESAPWRVDEATPCFGTISIGAARLRATPRHAAGEQTGQPAARLGAGDDDRGSTWRSASRRCR